MSKSMFVDGKFCRTMEQAASRIGCHKTTLMRLTRRGIYRYKGHTYSFYDERDKPKMNVCPHCGTPLSLRIEVE